MKRTKQKGSPQLRPASRGGKSGGGSVASSPAQTPELSPSQYALEPPATASWQLSQSAPTTIGRNLESRQATFRSDGINVGALLKPPAARSSGTNVGTPQTGLSVLMNGGVGPAAQPGSGSNSTLHTTTPGSALTNRVMASLTPAQQQRYQQDLLERENQASSLAAAGLVAEKVSLTGAPSSQPPQPASFLAAAAPTASNDNNLDGAADSSSTEPNPMSEVEASMNWSLMDTLGAMQLDDMDMDFATLFDPVNEMMWNNLQSSGHKEQPQQPPSTSDPQPSQQQQQSS